MKKIILMFLLFFSSFFTAHGAVEVIGGVPGIYLIQDNGINGGYTKRVELGSRLSGGINRTYIKVYNHDETVLIDQDSGSTSNNNRYNGGYQTYIDFNNGKYLFLFNQGSSSQLTYVGGIMYNSNTDLVTFVNFGFSIPNLSGAYSGPYNISTKYDDGSYYLRVQNGFINITDFNISSPTDISVGEVIPYYNNYYSFNFLNGGLFYIDNSSNLDVMYNSSITGNGVINNDIYFSSFVSTNTDIYIDGYDLNNGTFNIIYTQVNGDTQYMFYDLLNISSEVDLIDTNIGNYFVGKFNNEYYFFDSDGFYISNTLLNKHKIYFRFKEINSSDYILYYDTVNGWSLDSDILPIIIDSSFSGGGGILPGSTGTGSYGGNISDVLGVDCYSTFSFANPVCWIDSIGEGLQNLPGFSLFSERLETYSNFFDYSLTPGDYTFSVGLPTGSNNLEMESYNFTIASSYIPNRVAFTEAYESDNVLMNYFFLLLFLIIYYSGIFVFLYVFIFGIGVFLFQGLKKIISLFTFDILGSKYDTEGSSSLLGIIFMVIFFGTIIVIFDYLLNPVLSIISSGFIEFKEIFGHLLSLLYYVFTIGNGQDYIIVINYLNPLFTTAILAFMTYILVNKYGKLF